jgi:hypothetical protein
MVKKKKKSLVGWVIPQWKKDFRYTTGGYKWWVSFPDISRKRSFSNSRKVKVRITIEEV